MQGKQILQAFFSKSTSKKINYVFCLSYRVFTGFLSGQCVEAVILGTMFVIVMTIFRLPYAVMIGVMIAITALIPILGGYIGCIVGTFLIAVVNPMQAIIFIILFLVLQQIEGNVIYPHVVGNSVGLPSIWILAAVSIGGSLFGVVGVLLFIPLCSVLYTLFRDYVKNKL